MAKKVGPYAVTVTDADGNPHTFQQGSELPEWAEKLVDNPLAFEDGEVAESDQLQQIGVSGPPPQSGKGSGRDTWARYAFRIGVTVTEDDSRDDIIEKIEAAGFNV